MSTAAEAAAALLVLKVGKLIRMWSVLVSLRSDGVSLKDEVPVGRDVCAIGGMM